MRLILLLTILVIGCGSDDKPKAEKAVEVESGQDEAVEGDNSHSEEVSTAGEGESGEEEEKASESQSEPMDVVGIWGQHDENLLTWIELGDDGSVTGYRGRNSTGNTGYMVWRAVEGRWEYNDSGRVVVTYEVDPCLEEGDSRWVETYSLREEPRWIEVDGFILLPRTKMLDMPWDYDGDYEPQNGCVMGGQDE